MLARVIAKTNFTLITLTLRLPFFFTVYVTLLTIVTFDKTARSITASNICVSRLGGRSRTGCVN